MGISKMVEEKEVMDKITQVEDNEEYPHPNPRDHQFVLLSSVTQDDGWPLPMEEFMGRAMVQMICDVTGVVPKEMEILMDQEVVVGSRGSVLYSGGIQRDTGFISLGRTGSYSR